jgi:hypothetical protein
LKLGFYANFPASIHATQHFVSILTIKKLQEKLLQALYAANRQEFSFEEVSNPTFPEGTVIFEFGIAEAETFNFLDEEELQRAQCSVAKERLPSLDFFCSIRFYKGKGEKKAALKFDYYMLRTVFGRDSFEVQVFHERGPRYVSPQDLISFVTSKVNEATKRKVLKTTNV